MMIMIMIILSVGVADNYDDNGNAGDTDHYDDKGNAGDIDND